MMLQAKRNYAAMRHRRSAPRRRRAPERRDELVAVQAARYFLRRLWQKRCLPLIQQPQARRLLSFS